MRSKKDWPYNFVEELGFARDIPDSTDPNHIIDAIRAIIEGTDYYSAVVHRYYYGETLEEVGACLGISASAAGQRIIKAGLLLQKCSSHFTAAAIVGKTT